MVRLEEHKSLTEHKKIEKIPPADKVYIPLSQHLGRACVPKVAVGDKVALGQLIASAEAAVYAPIHASVSGKVSAIQEWPHPVLSRCKAIVIENDHEDKTVDMIARTEEEIEKLSPVEIRKIILEAGVVGMGGASFPTHIKLAPPKKVDTLIINGAECEPYLTGDYRLMVEKTEEIKKGLAIIAKCLSVKTVYVAIEDNKPEAIEKFRVDGLGFTVKVLKTQYPQGGEKQLIKNIAGKEIPRGKLPFDIGVNVQNVSTVLAVYDAVYSSKPLYERVVTVSGSCVSNPKNLLVRIGTPFKDLVDFCGPLKEEPAKIVSGGPMMGVAQYSFDTPVIKSTTGIILMGAAEVCDAEELFCVRCGACVRACPVSLMPTLINLSSQNKRWLEAKMYGAADCIECGCCSYVCPSHIPLVQSIKRVKMELAK